LQVLIVIVKNPIGYKTSKKHEAFRIIAYSFSAAKLQIKSQLAKLFLFEFQNLIQPLDYKIIGLLFSKMLVAANQQFTK